MTKRAHVVGATIYAAPSLASRVVGSISAGQEMRGDVVEGEPVAHNPLWMKIEGYVPMVRVMDVEDTPTKRRGGKRKM